MADQIRYGDLPAEDRARAEELFDEAVNNPARRGDAMGDLFAGLGAAVSAMYEQRRTMRKAMREHRAAQPEAIARRKAGALKGWETRRERAAAEALARELEEGPVRPYTGQTCDAMTHNSIGQETFCWLDAGHEEDDHEDGLGCEWPREEGDDE
jgi:hypothetical protein